MDDGYSRLFPLGVYLIIYTLQGFFGFPAIKNTLPTSHFDKNRTGAPGRRASIFSPVRQLQTSRPLLSKNAMIYLGSAALFPHTVSIVFGGADHRYIGAGTIGKDWLATVLPDPTLVAVPNLSLA